MLRLPRFKYLRPKTAREAAHMAAELGPRAMFVAGGTDLFPKLKRRQFEVEALIGLDFLSREIRNGSTRLVIGAGVTLAAAAGDAASESEILAVTPRLPASCRLPRFATPARSAATCASTRDATTTT